MDCLKYFNFVSLSALRCLPVFPFVLGLQRWESFLISARSFFYFFWGLFSSLSSYSLNLFSVSVPPCAARLLSAIPFVLGLQRWESFFIPARSILKLFSRLFTPSFFFRIALFSVFKAALRCFVFYPPFPFGIAKVRLFLLSAKYYLFFFWNFMVAALFISALFFSADPTPPQFAFVHIKVKHFLSTCQGFFWILFTRYSEEENADISFIYLFYESAPWRNTPNTPLTRTIIAVRKKQWYFSGSASGC